MVTIQLGPISQGDWEIWQLASMHWRVSPEHLFALSAREFGKVITEKNIAASRKPKKTSRKRDDEWLRLIYGKKDHKRSKD